MLTDAQKTAFDTEGYLVVDDVFDVDAIRAEYAALLDTLYEGWLAEGRVPEAQGWEARLLAAYRAKCDWFQPMDCSLPGDTINTDTPMHFGPAIFDLVTHPRLLDLVEDLIGPEITSNPIQHIRIKPPATDLASDEIRAHITATDWHQDRGVAHAEADATQMVTVWCAITDATPENGCLQVMPRAHKGEILPHCTKTQTGIPDQFIDAAAAKPLPVHAGGVVVFHPLTPHASLVNKTEGFRWSFDLRYNRTGQPTGRSHFPAFVARSRNAPETELRDWQEWRTIWEDAREQLAVAPHIPIHRWDSTAPYCA